MFVTWIVELDTEVDVDIEIDVDVEFVTEVDVDIDVEVGKRESQTLPKAKLSRGLSVFFLRSCHKSQILIKFHLQNHL